MSTLLNLASSMRRSHITTAAPLALTLALAAGPMPAAADEVDELKAAVAALQKRLDELETRAQTVDDTNDRQTDQIAMARASVGTWVSNFTWRGDFRYRNENIEQQHAKTRNRDRIRVRAGFQAKVNETVRTELVLATTEGGDPRSSNQTLSGENTRKPITVDQAYVEWQPNASWKVTGGKMRYPWVRPGQSVLFDGDINPEGLAVNFSRSDFFASAFYNILEERSTLGESTMAGGQVGWRPTLGAGRLTLAAAYFDFNSVQRRNPFFNNSANGNTTTAVAANCIAGATPCLVSGFQLTELSAEWSQPVAGRPLTVYGDYFKNSDAANDLDTAYSAGVMYGRAADPGTWEVGYLYQKVEKDSLFGQYIDSDYGAGNTDFSGGQFKVGYAFARNWVLNVAYQVSQTNIDVPVTVAGVGPVLDRDYKRLQVDMNFRY
jgi:hypothetical protein